MYNCPVDGVDVRLVDLVAHKNVIVVTIPSRLVDKWTMDSSPDIKLYLYNDGDDETL